MQTRAGRIDTVADLAGLLTKTRPSSRLLFRGQNVNEPLLPRIARLAQQRAIPPEKLAVLERRMLERFKKEGVALVREIEPRTDWDWLSIAEHNGLPTRLLDWSANSLAALWFAVAPGPLRQRQEGTLWVLEVRAENEKTPSVREDIFKLRRTFVFQPFHLDPRIATQSAWFSVHPYLERGRLVPLNENSQFQRSLKRYSIAPERFGALQRELRLMGVTHAAMFPDLPGLCAEIAAESIGSLDVVSPLRPLSRRMRRA
jgi:hypothetical protein